MTKKTCSEISEIVNEESPEIEIRQELQQRSSVQPVQGEQIIVLKRRKRALKWRLTRLRHQVEKLCITDSAVVSEVENKAEQLWRDLEETQEVLDEISQYYISVGQSEKQLESNKESDDIEVEFVKANRKRANVY